MIRLALPLALAAALTPATVAQAATLPELLQQALATPASAQAYAFDFVDVRKGDKPGTVRGRIDPSRPEGDRVTIFEATGEDADIAKLDTRYERNATGDIWCDRLAAVDGPVTDKGVYAGGRKYAFTPKARDEAGGDERKLYKQLVAEVTVDPATAQVRAFSARLPKPWKPNVMAKLNFVEMTGQCAPAPDGRAYHVQTTMTLRGSALGASFSQDIHRTVTNLTPVASGS